MSNRLPVEDCLPEVVAAIRAQRPVILRAPPGAGKTTAVPPSLLHADCFSGQILLLQPRRIAARAAAHRLSSLAGEPVGKTYGYHVRFDRRISSATKVIAMTTGILLRRMTDDPLLEDVGCVILDEFHERSLELDLALGMIQRIRTTLRPELRLVIMSATLETQPINDLIADAVTVESHGRAYEVEIRYDESLSRTLQTRDAIVSSVVDRVPVALARSAGDVLVFLPGVGEIHHAAERLQGIANRESLDLCKLYGDLSPSEQDAVLAPSNRRKLVLATNVAETSVTIPNVTCVIDTGLARVLEHDASVGIPSLRLQPISKASADQRAGRAGRTAPGICFRLWPIALHRSRADHTPPEVLRADLSSALLTLACWGERDVDAFPWVTSPSAHDVAAAIELLNQLGATDSTLAVSPLGVQMNRFPLHPRLSRLLIAARDNRCVSQASLAAALLSERDPFTGPLQEAMMPLALESDLVQRVIRLERHANGKSDSGIHPGGAKNIQRVAASLRQLIDEAETAVPEGGCESAAQDELPGIALSRSLLDAYPDRVAKRRAIGSSSAVIVGGRGVKLDRSSSVRCADMFVCVSVDGKGDESLVRIASAVDENWLPEQLIDRKRESFFHPTLKSVVARDRVYFVDLLISESTAQCTPDEETAELLFANARSKLDQIWSAKDKPLQSWINRWRFLNERLDSCPLPISADQAVDDVLRELCRSRTSFAELSRAPWLDHLKALLNYEQAKWFDHHAPESITVPSGNQIRLDYASGKLPVLAVRIQEIFGWAETPRLAGGRVPLQLHLLGPNHRPQQITDDLASFWRSTYIEVRKELKRRYPKHHWPDDPATAKATANGLKPKS